MVEIREARGCKYAREFRGRQRKVKMVQDRTPQDAVEKAIRISEPMKIHHFGTDRNSVRLGYSAAVRHRFLGYIHCMDVAGPGAKSMDNIQTRTARSNKNSSAGQIPGLRQHQATLNGLDTCRGPDRVKMRSLSRYSSIQLTQRHTSFPSALKQISKPSDFIALGLRLH